MARKLKKSKVSICVFCEGESEQAYTDFLKSKFQDLAVFKRPSSTGLFDDADNRFKKDPKYRDYADVIDEIWFFFDVEEKDIEEVETGTEGIKISSDVIAVIAGVAVSEVPGVFGMAGGFAGGITEVLKGKKNLAKGIKVDTTDNKAKIDVNIIVDYGARIPDVAFEIQNRVKTAVENMTGLKVEEVNVHVQGVNTESLTEESKEEETEETNSNPEE